MKNKLIIGAIGRFSEEKGFDVFIEALAILKRKRNIFEAIIAGDGKLKEKYVEQVKNLELSDNVKFVGWLESKKDFFNYIDIFCLPSRQESFGIVLLEAMSFKKPIVATDCDGPNDILKHDVNALICKKACPESIAAELQKLLHNPALIEELGQGGYKNLLENYTMERVSKKIESALDSIKGSIR